MVISYWLLVKGRARNQQIENLNVCPTILMCCIFETAY